MFVLFKWRVMSKGELFFMTLCFVVVFLLGVVCLLHNVFIGSVMASICFFMAGIYLTVILKDVFDND